MKHDFEGVIRVSKSLHDIIALYHCKFFYTVALKLQFRHRSSEAINHFSNDHLIWSSRLRQMDKLMNYEKGSFTQKKEPESHFFPLCNSDRLKIGGLRSAAIFVFRNCSKTFSWSVFFRTTDRFLVWGSHESTKHGSFRNSFFGAIVEPAWILPPSLFLFLPRPSWPVEPPREAACLVLSCEAYPCHPF